MISFKLNNTSPVKEYDDIELARGSNFEPNGSIDHFPNERRYFDQDYIGPSDIVIDKDRYHLRSYLFTFTNI